MERPLLARSFRFLAAGVVLGPVTANAHLVCSGLGPVYDGVCHFALSPEEILSMVALAMFAGMRGAAQARLILFLLPGAWLAAGIMGFPWGPRAFSAFTASSLLLTGGLLATGVRAPRFVTAAIAVLLGCLYGSADGVSFAEGPGFLALIGGASALFAALALFSSLVVPLRTAWAMVVVRVAGSWIAAFGLLLLGWVVRSGR